MKPILSFISPLNSAAFVVCVANAIASRNWNAAILALWIGVATLENMLRKATEHELDDLRAGRK